MALRPGLDASLHNDGYRGMEGMAFCRQFYGITDGPDPFLRSAGTECSMVVDILRSAHARASFARTVSFMAGDSCNHQGFLADRSRSGMDDFALPVLGYLCGGAQRFNMDP